MTFRLVVGFVATVVAMNSHTATSFGDDLFSGFEPGWRRPWMERDLARRSNAFRVEADNGHPVLRIDSRNSASALWRRVAVDATEGAILSWRWKISMSLDHIDNVRRRRGDDYAARVAVMFDGKPFDGDTPFLIYVWAGNETIGSTYPSPYTDKAGTIVVRSGDASTGEWHAEKRDVAEDFERYFGRRARRITGVALMVDTDNTDSQATAWFDELILRPVPTIDDEY